VTSLRAGLPTIPGSSSDFDWVKRFLPFPMRADRLRGPLPPYSLGTGGFFRGIKRLGREAGHTLYCKDYGCVELARPLFPSTFHCALMACTGRACVMEVRIVNM
jgi:hypothetical protein